MYTGSAAPDGQEPPARRCPSARRRIARACVKSSDCSSGRCKPRPTYRSMPGPPRRSHAPTARGRTHRRCRNKRTAPRAALLAQAVPADAGPGMPHGLCRRRHRPSSKGTPVKSGVDHANVGEAEILRVFRSELGRRLVATAASGAVAEPYLHASQQHVRASHRRGNLSHAKV